MASTSQDHRPLLDEGHDDGSNITQLDMDDDLWRNSSTAPKPSIRAWTLVNQKNIRYILYAFILLTLILTVRHVFNSTLDEDYGKTSLFQIPKHIHGRPSDFNFPSKDYSWYETNCYPKDEDLGRSITDIYKKLEFMKKSYNSVCSQIPALFSEMFTLEYIEAPIKLPTEFQKEVKGWLGNDPELFDQLNHQKVYKIITKGSHEETVFNPLRSKRPSSKSKINPSEYIANLTASTQSTCDFCKYKEHTAQDVFGRIDNQYSASASNTFKLAKFHGLFFPKSHHPIEIPFIALADLFLNTSRQWFETAHKLDDSQRYPSLLWDVLPHAGASQVHPHVHGLLGVTQYAGAFEKLHAISQDHFQRFGRSYWTDLIQVHVALGLGMKFGDSVAIVPLFARKDNEYLILSPDLDSDFASLVYSVLEGYKKELGVYCFSGGGAYHWMGEGFHQEYDSYPKPGLPVMFRFGSRGDCTSISSDVSSLELYTVNNINSDISKTFYALEKSIRNFTKVQQNNN